MARGRPIESVCPHCGSVYRTTADQVGHVYGCKVCRTECIVPSAVIDPGMRFGDYVIEHPLGTGATGEVHLARHATTGHQAAVKILMLDDAEDEVDIHRFLREAKHASQLSHPAIVGLYEAAVAGKYHYLAMEYVEGQTLDKYLRQQGSFRQHDALAIVQHVASAMHYAWETHQIVHRDIKPSNIMLANSGQPKLMDLGISKSLMADYTVLTAPDTVIGSPPYMSPEQCTPSARLDHRSDIYSLGATLFHMVTGHYLFEGASAVDTIRMQRFSPLPDPRRTQPNLDDGTVALLARMLAKSPHHRHASWADLMADIARLLERLQ